MRAIGACGRMRARAAAGSDLGTRVARGVQRARLYAPLEAGCCTFAVKETSQARVLAFMYLLLKFRLMALCVSCSVPQRSLAFRKLVLLVF